MYYLISREDLERFDLDSEIKEEITKLENVALLTWTGADVREILKEALDAEGIDYSDKIFEECLRYVLDTDFEIGSLVETAIEEYIRNNLIRIPDGNAPLS